MSNEESHREADSTYDSNKYDLGPCDSSGQGGETKADTQPRDPEDSNWLANRESDEHAQEHEERIRARLRSGQWHTGARECK